MIFLIAALAFYAGFLSGRKLKLKGEYNLYKKTNGLFEPIKRS